MEIYHNFRLLTEVPHPEEEPIEQPFAPAAEEVVEEERPSA
jgi:hypothetical protein